MPLDGDVRSPQRLTLTMKAHQQQRVLKSDRHLANSEVERVGLQPPVVQKRAEEGVVELEACHVILLRNHVALAVSLDKSRYRQESCNVYPETNNIEDQERPSGRWMTAPQ
jgi:hypothetical protein